MPPAIRVPYRFLAIVRIRNARQINSAYSDSTSAAPTKPYVSPTTAKMKSVWFSGRKCSLVWLACATPRPVFSPEPIAISDSVML